MHDRDALFAKEMLLGDVFNARQARRLAAPPLSR
jgi:hypothetical protein